MAASTVEYERAVAALERALALPEHDITRDASGFSDVDLLVSPATSGSAAGARTARALIGAIRERLEESRFPYKVDLVYEPDLAEAYREAVTRERIALN